MPRVAALYDVHANLPALEAVLAEVADVDVVVIGGDVVWGPWPRETMELLLSLPGDVRFIMGNADRDVFGRAGGSWKASNDWCADRLTAEHLDFLRTRPSNLVIDGVLYCHGSPRSDEEPITTATPDDRVREMVDGVREDVVVFGHTHAQFERRVDRWRLVNPGSVGNPFGEPGAYWAVIGRDVELRFTAYDTAATAERVRASGFPNAEMQAAMIERPSPASMAAKLFG